MSSQRPPAKPEACKSGNRSKRDHGSRLQAALTLTPADRGVSPQPPACGYPRGECLLLSLLWTQNTHEPNRAASWRFCLSHARPGQVDRALAFDQPDAVRYRIRGRNREQHRHRIGKQVPFFYSTCFLLRQGATHVAQVATQRLVEGRAAILRDEHHGILAVPFRSENANVIPSRRLTAGRSISRTGFISTTPNLTKWAKRLEEGVVELWISPQMAPPNSYRLMKSPMTRSCIRSCLGKTDRATHQPLDPRP